MAKMTKGFSKGAESPDKTRIRPPVLDKANATRYRCTLYRIFWVGNLRTGDCVTIGVMMIDEESGFADAKFTTDLLRLKRIEGVAELDFFMALEDEFRSRISGRDSRPVFLAKVPDWASSQLQFSAPEAVLTDAPAAEFARQVAELLVSPVSRVARKRTRRVALRSQMIDVFKHYDVWNSMLKQISMRDYFSKCRVKLDCGYLAISNPGEQRQCKLFHALDIEKDSARVAELAEGYPDFKKSYLERTDAQAVLTVIGKYWEPGQVQSENFRLLDNAGIQMRTILDVPALASTARTDLGLRSM